ncbi:MAG: WecB/TagA/CpsF family glycosyltransferase [Candidatus Moraniibacteriota bacterium]|jgi:N-acetylglucosaminyldiphosphoundecaprenol N-acetyl-beta-D-mannosaminyltransferase
MKMKKDHTILGVKIDNLSRSDILKRISFFLDEKKFHQIATINPEFLLEAQKNLCFRIILNNCALNVVDGFGIGCAFLRYGSRLKSRIAGADLMMEILKMANERGLGVFLAVNKDGLSRFEEVRSAILKIYPKLVIKGANFEKKVVCCMLYSTCPVLLCNFGAPYQEVFLDSQKDARIQLAMGVGGSFDFLTGKIKRAPAWMRQIGLEWLWRIFQAQQWKYKKDRLKRIWKAIIVFPIKIILCNEK